MPTALIAGIPAVALGEPVYAIALGLSWGTLFICIIRFGLLAVLAGGIVVYSTKLVRVWDPSSWYFPYVLGGLVVLLTPAVYGFLVSLRGRQLFKGELLDG